MTDPLSVGDPEAMRAIARTIQGIAENLRAAQAPAFATLESTTFTGRAAGRVRGAAGDAKAQADRAAADLEAIAAQLGADAGLVEAQNEALERAAEKDKREEEPPVDVPAADAPVEPPAGLPATPPVPEEEA